LSEITIWASFDRFAKSEGNVPIKVLCERSNKVRSDIEGTILWAMYQ
jgi:hypothetical protein